MKKLELILIATAFLLTACGATQGVPSNDLDFANQSSSSMLSEPNVLEESSNNSSMEAQSFDLAETETLTPNESDEVKEYLVQITSTKDNNLCWQTDDPSVAQEVINILNKKDREYDTLDIAESNYSVNIRQGTETKSYFLWLYFGEETAAIVQNKERTSITDENGDTIVQDEIWSIPIKESNQLRELLKEIA